MKLVRTLVPESDSVPRRSGNDFSLPEINARPEHGPTIPASVAGHSENPPADAIPGRAGKFRNSETA